ncbi:hypothetical protein HME9302_00914 [Alteripontixanthobacter maritimus]|uniref:Uncharacterized protein n=1 Tax=Alteripontixanthobacter maritimus TaxID=2161824 RepID=A0A369Q5L8_9SPHN|nr:hypothetical protein [Alteripontixanthobacter maritimus]RDC59720.1 hypothetical protein HME9302_00914 [Alteripontixanthobacter maritimus]
MSSPDPQSSAGEPEQARERMEQAVARIESALTRIRKSADTIRPAPPSVSALVVRHEALRDEVAVNLRELDALIGTLEE